MPETFASSPAFVQSLITRLRQGTLNFDTFIQGLGNQNIVLSGDDAQQLLNAGVITPDQFELVTGRNTYHLAESQGLFDRVQNFGEGVGQDIGFVGEAGVSRGQQAFNAGTFIASMLPVVGTGARATGIAARTPGVSQLLSVLSAPRRVPGLSGSTTRTVNGRAIEGARRTLSGEELISQLGSAGELFSSLLESDQDFQAILDAQEQGVQFTEEVEPGTGAVSQQLSDEEREQLIRQALISHREGNLTDEQLDGLMSQFQIAEDEVLRIGFQLIQEEDEEAAQAEVDRANALGEPPEPFIQREVPGLGTVTYFREEIRDQETGELIDYTYGAPTLGPQGLGADTLLQVSQALADPANALTLQAGFSRLLSNADPESLDANTQQLAALLGVEPGQTSVDVSGLDSSILDFFGIQDGRAPLPGTQETIRSNRDIRINEGGGNQSSINVPHTRQQDVQGLNLQKIPNLTALSDREIGALEALATVQGLNFDDIIERSKLVTPPGGQQHRSTVSR